MGLKITNNVHTNKGETTEMYINIDNISIRKNDNNSNSVIVNKYLNKAARDANEFDTCQCFEIPNILMLGLTISELEATNLYELVYTKIKEDLVSKGMTVEDLK